MWSFLFPKKEPEIKTPANASSQIIKDLEGIIIRLQTSINSLNIGFVIVDTTGEVVNINNTARSLLCSEFAKANLSSHICAVTELGERIKLMINFEDEIKKCLSTRTAVFLKDIELRELYLYIRIYPILLGGSKDTSKNLLTGVSVIIEDVTQEKVALRARDEFLSLASHELRTPLTAIRGNASLIREFYQGLLTEHKDLSEMVADIEESGVHLIRIVNEFLNVSRLEQGKLMFNRELFNLFDVLNIVINDMKFAASEKNLDFSLHNMLTPSDKLFVVADELRTREVLNNLVGNSIKYTDKGSIAINVDVSGDKVIMKITDTGRGIPLHNQVMLFKKFQQAGNSIYTRDSASGTGLGLYISRLLAERMAGTTYLERSEENNGSTFVFTLPLASPLEVKMLQATDKKEQSNFVTSGV